jgi:peptidoglycan biosynthesis protein MviN/MurJ (putative lipid II flippase)
LASALAGVLEYTLLRRSLIQRIGRTALPIPFLLRLWIAALVGAAVAWAIKMQIIGWHPIGMAIVVLGVYGLCYMAVTWALKVPEATSLAGRFRRGTKIKVEN